MYSIGFDQATRPSIPPLSPLPYTVKKARVSLVSDIPAGDGKIGSLFLQRSSFPAPCMADESFYLCMTTVILLNKYNKWREKNLHNIGFLDIFTMNYCTYSGLGNFSNQTNLLLYPCFYVFKKTKIGSRRFLYKLVGSRHGTCLF